MPSLATRRLARNPRVIVTGESEGLMALNLDSGQYLHLNSTGSFLLSQLPPGAARAVEDICRDACDQFDVDATTCSQEVLAFFDRCRLTGLVTGVAQADRTSAADMRRVHRFCARRRFRGVPDYMQPFAQAADVGLRLWRAPRGALRAAWLAAGTVSRRTGKSVLAQGAEQVGLALSLGVSPIDYYRYGFSSNQRRAIAHEYLYQHEVWPLLSGLGASDIALVTDKARFAARANAAGLAVPATLAVFRAGVQEDPGGRLPNDGDLFVKPVNGSKGAHAAILTLADDGRYHDRHGECFTPESLLASLAKRSVRTPMLLQPRLRTRAALADLTLKALVTVRTVTALDVRGAPTHVLSVLKMPLGSGDTDNIGLASAITADGVLGRAFSYRLGCEGFERHPDTGARIAGRHVPGWADAVALALRAHAAFPQFFMLGWDVALSEHGPHLLEANIGWDTYTIQRPHDRPLGHTALGRLATEHLARTNA